LIQISLDRLGAHLRVLVKDNGQGIEPEFLSQVFERFKQADGATTRSHGGLGLGLAISRHIVELHGGSIEVQSQGQGHGSTFAVLLPLDRRESNLSPAQGTSHDSSIPPAIDLEIPPELLGIKVLVVDDEQDSRELVATLIERCGARVVTADSASSALAKLQSEKPDVLISDIGMPGVDGYDLIREVRALGQDHGGRIPAAALTAFARAEDRSRALDAGYMMHLVKPVEPSELIAALTTLVRFATRH
jgi:CheY-like chemotaxis protein